jgi:hypothetical protein
MDDDMEDSSWSLDLTSAAGGKGDDAVAEDADEITVVEDGFSFTPNAAADFGTLKPAKKGSAAAAVKEECDMIDEQFNMDGVLAWGEENSATDDNLSPAAAAAAALQSLDMSVTSEGDVTVVENPADETMKLEEVPVAEEEPNAV